MGTTVVKKRENSATFKIKKINKVNLHKTKCFNIDVYRVSLS